MLTFLIILQVLVAVFMILVVLLQPGNRGGAGAALGGAGGDTVFGGRGANTLLTKVTFVAAAVFMFCNFALAYYSMPPKSVLETSLPAAQAGTTQPVLDLDSLPEAESAALDAKKATKNKAAKPKN